MNFVKKSILAGILIGLGGFADVYCGISQLGSLLFSIGLIGVILLGCNLFTGKVGYARSISEAPALLSMCVLNMLGAILVGLMVHPIIYYMVDTMTMYKLSHTPVEIFIRAVICGAMVYLSVELYKKKENILLIILPVYAFVITGSEHCIANAFFFAAAHKISPEIIWFMIICIVGNTVGALVVSLLEQE